MRMQKHIELKLLTAFKPEHLDVINESPNHHVPDGAESHFKVTVVSKVFEDKSLIQRHRLINTLLADELASSIHALSLHTYTAEEWSKKGGGSPKSPACRGGSEAG